MCGIIGHVVPHGTRLDLSETICTQTVSAMRHRGPDMEGTYRDDNVWLGHTRLSILDLSDAARQPMKSHNGQFEICYNGEVYNFFDLHESFSLSGIATNSDTEVILEAFAKFGVDILSKFNGMFGFAIYDKHNKKLWLVRDRLGIKPLYYHSCNSRFSFGSELEPLLELGGEESLKCNVSAISEWLFYGNTLGERTLYQGIKKLLPGHFLELDLKTFEYKIECYWNPQHIAGLSKYKGSSSDCANKIRDLLELSVKRQLVSDVPVGVFLSGGVDSSAIVAFASKHYKGKLATYSAGFDFDRGVNELPQAKKIAQHFGTDHSELHISGFEVADIIEKMVWHHGTPFSDAANIPLYLLSSEVCDTTRVILQGDGGDEIFGGYSRYSTLSFYRTARFIAKIASVINICTPRTKRFYKHQRYFRALSASTLDEVMSLLLTTEDVHFGPEMIFASDFKNAILKSYPFARYHQCRHFFKDEDIVNQMLLVDSMIILPDIFLEKVDRSTMAASVETRVPFLDNDLVDFCMNLTGNQKVSFGKKKWLLKKALDGIVPNYVLFGKKTGFGVPVGHWLRSSLKSFFFDNLRTFQRKHPLILENSVIERLYNEHLNNKRDHSFLLWKILNYLVWMNGKNIKISAVN
jgi:asparagine synthase (glutamine-hydrolysing)